ncbi:MAG TPA: hypothetical protein VG733_19150, partial [Chthoniobacteraceae bacterium]|nr:hypothetical protein [Chthoniobacteraceae bacterium]
MSFSGTSAVNEPSAEKHQAIPNPTPATTTPDPLGATDSFPRRHLGPNAAEIAAMARSIGFDSLDTLVGAAVPESIRLA